MTAHRLILLASALLPLLAGCPEEGEAPPAGLEVEAAPEGSVQPKPVAQVVDPVLPVPWEFCAADHQRPVFSRTPVPAGWLVLVSGEEDDAAFVPDPDHRWLAEGLPAEDPSAEAGSGPWPSVGIASDPSTSRITRVSGHSRFTRFHFTMEEAVRLRCAPGNPRSARTKGSRSKGILPVAMTQSTTTVEGSVEPPADTC